MSGKYDEGLSESLPLINGDNYADSYGSSSAGSTNASSSSSSINADITVNQGPERKRQPAFTTIFAVWNTMIGSSLLSLTWGFGESGICGGILVILLIGLVTWYTMSLIVRRGEGRYPDFVEVCKEYLGRTGYWFCWLGSVVVLTGASFVYDILLTTNAYSLVNGFIRLAQGTGGSDVTSYDSTSSPSSSGVAGDDMPGAPYWTPVTAPIIFAVLFLSLLNMKSMKMYVKLSSIGIFGMFYVVIFLFVSAVLKRTPWDDPSHKRYVAPQPHSVYLAGIMNLAFFVHNFVLTVTRNTDDLGKSLRDVSIGFSMGGLSYAAVGTFTYCFLGNGVPQDYLDYFPDTYIYAMTAKIALLYQLCCVLPFVIGLLRSQIFLAIKGQEFVDNPNRIAIFVFSVAIMTVATLLAIFYPNVADVIRYTGAICGVIYIFALPNVVQMAYLKRKNRLTPAWIVFHVAVILVGVAVLVTQFI